MGISRPAAEFLARHCKEQNVAGNCLTLGRQVITFDGCFGFELAARHGFLPVKENVIELRRDHPVAKLLGEKRLTATYGPYRGFNLSDESFFKLIGFDSVKSLDYSDYEKSEYILDLNSSPDEISIAEKFDLVYDGGTIEHVFNIANCLGNICQLTKVGGYVVHETPCNNYVDHGFYQISPTLFLDFYKENDWDIIDIRLLQIPFGSEDPMENLKIEKMPYFTSEYRPKVLNQIRTGGLPNALYNVQFIARKTPKSTFHRVPQQGTFRTAWRVTPR